MRHSCASLALTFTNMNKTLHFPSALRGRINLPSSKSLTNRALLLCALSGAESSVERMSSCDDTYAMWRALRERPHVVDVMAAGTAMRFLTAFFAVCHGEEHVLTGTERMCERPIGVLVDALRELGAQIAYMGREGYPPLRVKGATLHGGHLTLSANVSSQYVSALCMIAPLMQGGLELDLQGEVASRPYISMTLSLMKHFGVQAEWTSDRNIAVRSGHYTDGIIYQVEGDWSAASYWYEMLALTTDADARIELPYLYAHSEQGDSRVAQMFELLGVKTTFDDDYPSVILSKEEDFASSSSEEVLEIDFSEQPDLAQTFVVTCAMLRRPFHFTGLRSLRIKETDRIAALCEGLAHFGITLTVGADDSLSVLHYEAGTPAYNGLPIATHQDHRMALAFAPTAIVCPGVEIAHAEVVTKSYPHFWDDLDSLQPHQAK